MEPVPDSSLNSALELFREAWLSELGAPIGAAPSSNNATTTATGTANIRHKKQPNDNLERAQPQTPVASATPTTTDPTLKQHVAVVTDDKRKEPVTALDHYEAGVEKESQGSLGDSIRFYRKAFRMDSSVDQKYREKYYPKTNQPPAKATLANVPGATSTLARSSAGGNEDDVITSDLIASFAGLAIARQPPPVEGAPDPPCPIAELPTEIVSQIFACVAAADVRDYVRLSYVCKRFAYLVGTDALVWRQLCESTQFGFAGMPRHLSSSHLNGGVSRLGDALETKAAMLEEHRQREAREQLVTQCLLHKLYGGSWKKMWCCRPRIRFCGVYISIVNYWRPGQAGPNIDTWDTPLHIVTYYRYLRFFRDGTVMSLLTTLAPPDVVPRFTRPNVQALETTAVQTGHGVATHTSAPAIRGTLHGVWKMGCAWSQDVDMEDETPSQQDAAKDFAVPAEEAERSLFIEVVGKPDRYLFQQEMVISSVGGRNKGLGVRNNKLLWKNFHCYNKLTGDRSEFHRKHEKPFFFSRVVSYGIGD